MFGLPLVIKKNVLILLMMLLGTGSLFAQTYSVQLIAEKEMVSDFFIGQVIDGRTEKGFVQTPDGQKTIGFKLGFVNEIKNYFQQLMPVDVNKTPVIAKVVLLEVSSSNGSGQKLLHTKLQFLIRNGAMLVMLAEEDSQIEISTGQNLAQDYSNAIGESLSNCIFNFNSSNWRMEPMAAFIIQKKQNLGKAMQSKVIKPGARPENPKAGRANLEDLTKHRIDLSFGYSQRLEKLSKTDFQEVNDYLKGLHSGFNVTVNYAYFNSKYYGFGVLFNYMNTQSTLKNLSGEISSGVFETYDLTEIISIGMIGPTLSGRLPVLKDKIIFNGFVSMGYLFYENNQSWETDLTITGGSVGLGLLISIDYRLNSFMHVKLGSNLFYGSISTYNAGAFSSQLLESENLSHVDFNTGIVFSF
jgi:hypothetical protein